MRTKGQTDGHEANLCFFATVQMRKAIFYGADVVLRGDVGSTELV